MRDKEGIFEKIRVCLLKNEGIRACFVFGSFVTNDFNDDSDLDIAVLVNEKIQSLKLLSMRQEVERLTDRDVDLIQIDNDLSLILRNEIATKGELVFSNDTKASDRFFEKTLQMYLDFMRFREPLEEAYIQKKTDSTKDG